ncbi:MAG: SdpI family protein [Lachnospiraceae bacterium]|nr:SdpI family protein [Lachnospiraceae bacterium]
MKKIMWFISFISLLGTAAVMGFLPDSVPMHYDFSGNIDRWGSKYEEFLFPAVIILMSLFWTVFIRHFEKKAEKATEEKESKEARNNARVLSIVGICMNAMFTVEHGIILYRAYNEAAAGADMHSWDIGRITTVLAGLLLIVLGNITTKTRKNRIVGVRLAWSMYNDNTWRKTNRFGAIVLMLVGVISVLTGLLLETPAVSVLILLGALLLGTVIIVIYAHKVYVEEIDLEKHETM